MRTTLDLNGTLLARAKALAVRERTTLTRLIEEGLSLRMEPRERSPLAAAAITLPVYRKGTGLAPGIDPLSNRSLLDAADEDDIRKGRLR